LPGVSGWFSLKILPVFVAQKRFFTFFMQAFINPTCHKWQEQIRAKQRAVEFATTKKGFEQLSV
jgi:hypothetical protein